MMDWSLHSAAVKGDHRDLAKFEASDFKMVTPHENNVLHIAAMRQRLHFAEVVLALHTSLHTFLLFGVNKDGDTPLHVAASVGFFLFVQFLVGSFNQVTSDIENPGTIKDLLMTINKNHDTALHVALKKGHVDVAKLLFEKEKGLLDMVNENNESPLYLAIERGLFDTAVLILETSGSVSGIGPKGMNALHAAVDSDIVSIDFLTKLVDTRQEMIKEVDNSGWTPLHYSVRLGKVEITRLLLQKDSSAAYISDKEGQCPLHLAASTGHVDAYRELVGSCPFVWELVDGKERTSLHSAVISSQKGIIRCILEMPEISLDLLNKSDVDGNTPLHLSVVNKQYGIFVLLLHNEEVDKRVMNHNHLTAAEIFYSQKQEISFMVARAYYTLQRFYKKPSQQQKIETKKKQEKADLQESYAGNVSARYEVHLIVAVLVAAVAFAAASQIPGGYTPDGTPTLMDEPVFKFFLVLDTVAFCFSVTSVFSLLYASRDGFRERTDFLYMSAVLLVMSLIAMAYAFVAGMYLISSKSRELAILPFLMVGFFVSHGFAYWFLDPRGSYSFGLEGLRQFVRKLVFQNSLASMFVRD